MIPLSWYLYLSAALFAVGLYGVLARKNAIAILLGIGLFLMESPTSPTSAVGNLVALLSGVGFALVTIFFRRLRALHGPSIVCLCNLATGFGAAPLVHDYSAILGLTLSGWAALILLGSVQIGLSYILYAAALKRVKPLRAATISLIEPILNPVLVFLLLHEVPSSLAILGAVAILGAIMMDLRLNSNEQ